MRAVSIAGAAPRCGRLFFGCLRRDERGMAAVEFGLIAPIFALILAGVSDFGGALYAKFNLSGGVSAGANYALVNATSVTSGGASTLATNLGSILTSGRSSNYANAVIVINNGITRTLVNGVATSTGTAANADACYCPTFSGTSVTWGSAATCGSTCTNGSVAGKFVQLTASRAYSPMFSSYGFLKDGVIKSTTVVQTE